MVKSFFTYLKVISLVRYIDKQLKESGFKIVHDKYLKGDQLLDSTRDLTEKEIIFINNIVRIVDKVCFYFTGNARCLHRSVVAHHIFREKALPIDLVIGVSKKPFMSHAWLEYRDHVVNDSPDFIKMMTVQFHTKNLRKIG